MNSFLRFVENNTRIYYSACILGGMAIRLTMAHGDWSLFFNPMWPLIR
jgi:hypothetical protein